MTKEEFKEIERNYNVWLHDHSKGNHNYKSFTHMRRTIEFAKYYHESELKKMRVTDVIGRSEQLIEFAKFIQKHKNEGLDYDCIEREVTDFLNQ